VATLVLLPLPIMSCVLSCSSLTPASLPFPLQVIKESADAKVTLLTSRVEALEKKIAGESEQTTGEREREREREREIKYVHSMSIRSPSGNDVADKTAELENRIESLERKVPTALSLSLSLSLLCVCVCVFLGLHSSFSILISLFLMFTCDVYV